MEAEAVGAEAVGEEVTGGVKAAAATGTKDIMAGGMGGMGGMKAGGGLRKRGSCGNARDNAGRMKLCHSEGSKSYVLRKGATYAMCHVSVNTKRAESTKSTARWMGESPAMCKVQTLAVLPCAE